MSVHVVREKANAKMKLVKEILDEGQCGPSRSQSLEHKTKNECSALELTQKTAFLISQASP